MYDVLVHHIDIRPPGHGDGIVVPSLLRERNATVACAIAGCDVRDYQGAAAATHEQVALLGEQAQRARPYGSEAGEGNAQGFHGTEPPAALGEFW